MKIRVQIVGILPFHMLQKWNRQTVRKNFHLTWNDWNAEVVNVISSNDNLQENQSQTRQTNFINNSLHDWTIHQSWHNLQHHRNCHCASIWCY